METSVLSIVMLILLQLMGSNGQLEHIKRVYWGEHINNVNWMYGVSYFDEDPVQVKQVCKDDVDKQNTTIHCRYLNITIQDRRGKWHKEMVLRQTFSIMLKKQYCYFFVPMDRTWIKVGPQRLDDNSTALEWAEYRNDTRIRTAAIHACRTRRTKEWTIGGTYTDRAFNRHDIHKRGERYVVGHVVHMASKRKANPGEAGEPSSAGDIYGDTKTYQFERKRSIATSDQNVIPFLRKSFEQSKFFGNDDDRDKWQEEAGRIDPLEIQFPSVGKPAAEGGFFSPWNEDGIPVSSKYPTIELMVAVDQLMLRNFSNDQDAFGLFMAKTVNVAESFFYLLDVRMRIVSLKVLPEYPFPPNEKPINIHRKNYLYAHYSRLDAYLLYLKTWFYRKFIDLKFNNHGNKKYSDYFQGMPDAIATFTSIYYTDMEAGHATDVFDDSTEAYKKHGNVFYVKPNMDHRDFVTDELSPYSTGAALVHQIGHVLGWQHKSFQNDQVGDQVIPCSCIRATGTCLLGSCESGTYLIPDFMNGCNSTFPIVNPTTQPQLYMWNTYPRNARASPDNGNFLDEFYTTRESMRVACFIAAIADIFILISYLFHMDIVSAQMRR